MYVNSLRFSMLILKEENIQQIKHNTRLVLLDKLILMN